MNKSLLRRHLERAELRRRLPEPALRAHLRRVRGLTRQQVADVLGVHRVTVSRWEAGTREPADDLLPDYLRVLGVDPEVAP